MKFVKILLVAALIVPTAASAQNTVVQGSAGSLGPSLTPTNFILVPGIASTLVAVLTLGRGKSSGQNPVVSTR